jgi:hypothetical protein
MDQPLFEKIRELRNAIAHSQKINNEELSLKLKDIGLSISPDEIPNFFKKFSGIFDRSEGFHFYPKALNDLISRLLTGQKTDIICDPWAGLGFSISTIQEITNPRKTLAFTLNENEANLGQKLIKNVEWKIGDPIELIQSLDQKIDVIFTILPFGQKPEKSLKIITKNRETIIKTDIGNQILVESAKKLNNSGIGFFIVPASFFFSFLSPFKYLNEMGLGVEAALSLPSRTFAPHPGIHIYLLIVRNHPVEKMFVAQLTGEQNTDNEILSNFKNKQNGGSVELGRFIEPSCFSGIDSLIVAERFQQKISTFGAPAKRIEELSSSITLGRFGKDFIFSDTQNAIFIPTIGNSDVVDSLDNLKLKSQNYVQVVVDRSKSNSRFVARFLNSELGRELREQGKTGSTILKLNKQTIKELPILVPDLATQNKMIEFEARIIAEQNIVMGLQAELAGYTRELWTNPRSIQNIDNQLSTLSRKLSGNLKQYAKMSLDQWFETTPFPLASILRIWQITPSQDYFTKYNHLLDFFEAIAEFSSLIFISAFKTNSEIFSIHEKKISDILLDQHLSFQRATIGTWKVIVEYLGKQTRILLSDEKNRATCADLFADSSCILPETISHTEFVRILSTTNKMRNDWRGHGGAVGPGLAKERNDRLLAELQKLREVMADLWKDFQLVHAINCRPQNRIFETDMEILTGSNSEFLKETRSLSAWLYVDKLYLCSKENNKTLQLLPLVKVGSFQNSVNNICHFYNRFETDNVRFVSYHYLGPDPDLYLPASNFDDLSKLFNGI